MLKKILKPLFAVATSFGVTDLFTLSSCSAIFWIENNDGPQPEPTDAIDFCSCEWLEICEACNKLEQGQWTEEEFCNHFTFGSTPATSLDDFIGQKRTVKVNNLDHEVIVLGYQQDFLDENHTKPVALTFQFNNAISREIDGVGLRTAWTSTSEIYSNYWDSNFFNALNGTDVDWYNDEENNLSVREMIENQENDLAKSIKDVSKGYLVKNSSDEWELSTKNAKFFCPTIANIFSKKGISDTDRSVITESDLQLYYSEGEQYQYFKNELGDSIVCDQYTLPPYSCLVKFDLSDTGGVEMTTCIPTFMLSYPNYLWYVYLDGSVRGIPADHHRFFGIAPCFCI